MKKFLIPSAEVLDNHLKNSPVDDIIVKMATKFDQKCLTIRSHEATSFLVFQGILN